MQIPFSRVSMYYLTVTLSYVNANISKVIKIKSA